MGLLIFLVLVGLVFAGWLLFGSMFAIDRSQKRATKNKEPQLDAMFDGRDQVLFEGKLVGLQPDVVMEGAAQRGYRCVSVTEGAYGTKTMVFQRVSRS